MANILIIDEDRATATRVAQALTHAGHTCTIETQGKEGLRKAEDEAVDLLLLDAMLPDLSGFEICRRIRSRSELFHLPIVFLTAMTSREEIQHGLSQGADDYLPKPADLSEVVRRVNKLINTTPGHEERVDPATDLPNADDTRRRLQAKVARGDQFALIYVELLGVRELSDRAGARGREKVFRHLARALRACGSHLAKKDFFAGHMGGGFFICMVPCGEAESYCATLQKSWRKHWKTLYGTLGLSGTPGTGPSDFLDLMMCVTARACKEPVSPQHLLDTLTRIRRSVGENVGGIHVDRRLAGV